MRALKSSIFPSAMHLTLICPCSHLPLSHLRNHIANLRLAISSTFLILTPLPVMPAVADLTERSHPQCRYCRGFPTVLYRLLAGSRVVRPLFPFLVAGLKDLLRTCLGATVRGNPQGYWFFKLCTRKPELDFFRTSLRHSKSIKIISMREIIFPRYAEMV